MTTVVSNDEPNQSPSARRAGSQFNFIRFLVVRLLAGAVTAWAAVTIGFFLLRFIPGSENIQTLIGATGYTLTEAQIAEARIELGLDKPLLMQYGRYLSNLLHGDLGTSYLRKQSVNAILAPQIGPTAQLAAAALVLAWVLAMLWILLTAGRPRTIETGGRIIEIVLVSLPQFWLGLMLSSVFAIRLGWFPVVGGNGIAGLVLPAVTLALPLAGFIGQLTRESFEEALAQPFILSARARGLSSARVRAKHALRHAIIPALAFSGQSIGWLFGGALVVEQIFARPGVGQVVFQAVSSRDMPLVLGVVIVVAIGYVLVSLVVDMLYRVVDPRIEVR